MEEEVVNVKVELEMTVFAKCIGVGIFFILASLGGGDG
jgi:hypothetical protein